MAVVTGTNTDIFNLYMHSVYQYFVTNNTFTQQEYKVLGTWYLHIAVILPWLATWHLSDVCMITTYVNI